MELGYNVNKINTLISDVGRNCSEIRSAMQSGWPDVQNSLHTEWVGTDEQSFEEKLVARVKELWQSIEKNCNIFMQNLQATGESWIKFQNSNIIDGSTAMDGMVGSIKVEPLTTQEPDIQFSKVTFSGEQDLGLQHGIQSAEVISESIRGYITAVYSKTKNLFDEMDASTAFIGAEQSQAVKKYIEEMGHAFARVTTCYKDLGEAMKELINRYEKQQSSVTESVTNNAPTIDTAGKQWDGIGE